MSDDERTAETVASATVEANGEDRAGQDQSLRFTPLRSNVTRAKAFTTGAEGAPALSRIIPLRRLQS